MNSLRCALFLFSLATTAVAQTTHIVDVGVPNNQFTPEFLEIRVGDTVRWVWVQGRHNVVSDHGAFDSGSSVRPPFDFSVLFDDSLVANFPVPGGQYTYYCWPNLTQGMVGTVAVLPTLSVSNLVAGSTAMLEVRGCGTTSPHGEPAKVFFAWSATGPGPTQTPYGDVSLSPPINSLPLVFASYAEGVATRQVQIPASASGMAVWIQALVLTPPLARLTQPEALVVG